MVENKTKPTEVSVDSFLDNVSDSAKRDDSRTLIQMMREITGEPPRMWGPTMIGFGTFHYVYASGHEGDIFLTGFSPRKSALTIYLSCGANETVHRRLAELGKVEVSKGCLYIKKLADIDLTVLREMIEAGIAELKAMPKPETKSKSTSEAKSTKKSVASKPTTAKAPKVAKASRKSAKKSSTKRVR